MLTAMRTTLSIGNNRSNRKAYTFLELMVTVSVLSIGIVGIYRALLLSLDYQGELSQRLYAINLLENEIALLENEYKANGAIPAGEDGKIIEVELDHRTVPFVLSISSGFVQSIEGLMPIEAVLTWPQRGRSITLKRTTYLVNYHPKPSADAPSLDHP